MGGILSDEFVCILIASFCHEAKICDLCSEVSCLYISNTKTMNLHEYSKGALFYILLASLFAATYPDTRQTHGIFHRLEPTRKRLVYCTLIDVFLDIMLFVSMRIVIFAML